MAIVVEDGTVVTGANSYVSEADLTTYASARGVTLSGDTEQLLIRAMDYVESLDFQGVKLSETQPLQWPRANVTLDGYALSINTIPQLLIDGLCEVAMSIDNGEDPLANIPRLKKRATVGQISVEYADGQATTLVRKVTAKLRKLLNGGGSSGTSFTVSRG